MRARRRRFAAWGLSLLLAAAWSIVTSTLEPVTAHAAQVVGPGSIQIVAGPAVKVRTPADGRLRGDGVDGTITGYAFAGHVGSGGAALSAAAGQRLVVFGLQGAHLAQSSSLADRPTVTPSAALVVDGSPQALPVQAGDAGHSPVWYLASVPAKARDVAVRVTTGGYPQDFSLTAGRREGPQPFSLYRDPASWFAVDTINQSHTVATPDPADGLPNAGFALNVAGVLLDWYNYDNPAVHTRPDQTYLVVLASGKPVGPRGFFDISLDYKSTLDADQVTLTLPDGSIVRSSIAQNTGDANEAGTGVIGGYYTFVVPADLTHATLNFTIGTVTAATVNIYSNPTPITIPVNQVVTYPVVFSAPVIPPLDQQTGPSPRGANPTAATTGSSGLPAGLIAALAAAAVVVVAAGLLLARRRRHQTPLAVANAPTTVSPMAIAISGWGQPPPPPAAPGPSNGNGQPPADHTTSQPEAEPGPERLPDIPTAPSPPPDGMVEIPILGPVTAPAWPGEAPTRATVTEVAAYEVLNAGSGHTAAAIADTLSNTDRTITAETVRTYFNALRRAVGAEQVPDGGRKGYRIVGGISTDWHRFQVLTQPDPAASDLQIIARQVEALSLIRGLPFSDAGKGAYEWARAGGTLADIERAVTATAGDLAGRALRHGGWSLAVWAAAQALKVTPTHEELADLLLTSATASGDMGQLASAWKTIASHYSDHHEPVPDTLAERYVDLRRTLAGASTER